jgi:hypothetical protein
MSQSNHSVGNVSAPVFRSDMNASLQALASLNSGATAPSTTYANMLWYDTLNNILKMRSEADDAWIDLGTLNQSTLEFSVAGLNFASVGEAQTGTDNTTLMTPLRVFQAIGQANVAPVKTALNAAGSAPVYACRAWVNFFGGNTAIIRGAGNVSSVTDDGVGVYTVNFTTALTGDAYATSGLCSISGQGGSPDGITINAKSASALQIFTRYANQTVSGSFDPAFVEIAVFQ